MREAVTSFENRVRYRIYSKNRVLSEADAITLNKNYLLYSSEYIWQHESFLLKYNSSEQVLEGSTFFGDCIDDEWHIVSILQQISKTHPGYVIQCNDNDGEFLLIEAADHLSKEQEPETTKNKVFIHRGELHIIPITTEITLEKAIEFIYAETPTVASTLIQQSAFGKIKAGVDFHYGTVLIPQRIAQILYYSPEIIATAIDAFYTREPSQMKYCNKMLAFPPTTSVKCTIKYTKTLYAQLHSVNIAPIDVFQLPKQDESGYKAAYMGMKLACGFEILFNQVNKDMGNGYQTFVDKLTNLGYYRGELKGSREYQRLESLARKLYVSDQKENIKDFQIMEMKRLYEEPLIDLDLFTVKEDESDDWLYLDPREVDDMLSQNKTTDLDSDDSDGSDGSLDDNEREQLAEMKGILGGFNSFVDKESSVGGVILPGDLSDDSSSDEDYQPISFNPDSFMIKIARGLDQNVGKEEGLEEVMEAMGRELDSVLEDDMLKDVDLDANLMKNLLESFEAQGGLSGPVSNIIGSLGLKLPKPNDS
jgi:hypothetical protein